jgi:hypothetical protein
MGFSAGPPGVSLGAEMTDISSRARNANVIRILQGSLSFVLLAAGFLADVRMSSTLETMVDDLTDAGRGVVRNIDPVNILEKLAEPLVERLI